MLRQIKTKFDEALASGAITFTNTTTSRISSEGVEFQIRLAPALVAKPASTLLSAATPSQLPKPNPFLPHDQKLFVSTIHGTHNLLLNKFCIVRDHILLTTREFQNQYNPLNVEDFTAILEIMKEMPDTMTFFNCGDKSGASVLHKHVQIIPVDKAGVPMNDLFSLLEITIPQGNPFVVPTLPFAHAAAFLPLSLSAVSANPIDISIHSSLITSLYRSALLESFRNAGFDYTPFINPPDPTVELPNPLPPSYNLVLTTRWMLIVPRRMEMWNGISVNSVGFAGMVFLKKQEDFEQVQQKGMMNLLKELTFPRHLESP
ncbi:hypothetical protein SeLEV6574_g05556 [Synchytrium endobioticum]|nr:hypothetical protein SeLEV6574_g05556 [Synchytrium endobioticum]